MNSQKKIVRRLGKLKAINRSKAIEEQLSIIVANARLIPDPSMQGATDTYSVPLDDIEEARRLLSE